MHAHEMGQLEDVPFVIGPETPNRLGVRFVLEAINGNRVRIDCSVVQFQQIVQLRYQLRVGCRGFRHSLSSACLFPGAGPSRPPKWWRAGSIPPGQGKLREDESRRSGLETAAQEFLPPLL